MMIPRTVTITLHLSSQERTYIARQCREYDVSPAVYLSWLWQDAIAEATADT